MRDECLYYLWPRGETWKVQRQRALERDKFTCQHCGDITRKDLQVHHIKPFRTFRTSRGANRLTNLITLCPSCHRVAEKALAKLRIKSHKDFVAATPFHGDGWAKARKMALTRDKYTCQQCGFFALKGLHVHHVIPGYAFDYDDLPRSSKHDLKNLITLCKNCHIITERYTKVAWPPYPHYESSFDLHLTYQVSIRQWPGARCPVWYEDIDGQKVVKTYGSDD